MAWGDGATPLGDRFAVARSLWNGRRGQTYQGFIKSLMRFGCKPLLGAAACLRRHVLAVPEHQHRFGFVALAVDGSRFDLARTAGHERVFGVAGKTHSAPQMWITTLWHMGLGLPWDWRIGRARASERHHLDMMLEGTPAGALIVADAGFTGYELLRTIILSGREVLLRVGRHVELLRDLGYAEWVDDQTVYLWPAHAQRDRALPLVLRLVTVRSTGDRRRRVYLLTSVTDRNRLSDEHAAALYRMRWGVELCYRSLKQTLSCRKLRSHAPAQALFEMHGLMLGLMLLGLLSVTQIVSAGHDPLSWSVACSLRVVRQSMRNNNSDWPSRLSEAVKDTYRRRYKTRRKWPRKKQTDPPPGKPRVRPATLQEVELAMRLQTI